MKRISRIIYRMVFFSTIILGYLIMYNQPTDDIFYHTGFWLITIIILSPILIIETEIYNIFIYVFLEEKNKTKTFLKTLSLVIALLFCGLFVLSYYVVINKFSTVVLVILLLYVLSKILLWRTILFFCWWSESCLLDW